MSWPWALAAGLSAALLASLAWGWYEAGWVRTRVRDVHVPGLPREMEGLRIAHLSDFHLGTHGRGRRATERAVDWVADRSADVVVVTGDLVSHPRGAPELRRLLERLRRPYVVLGNHDVSRTRDPFSKSAGLDDLHAFATLLRDQSSAFEHGGVLVQIVGVDADSYSRGEALPERLVDPTARLRILLCHFPGVVRRLPKGAFHLILAGHVHAGQIALPMPTGRLLLAHPSATLFSGLYETPAGTLHVSPGTGTTLVPVRFFARPEVTELVLRPAVPGRRA